MPRETLRHFALENARALAPAGTLAFPKTVLHLSGWKIPIEQAEAL